VVLARLAAAGRRMATADVLDVFEQVGGGAPGVPAAPLRRFHEDGHAPT
jgi:hypothetical protein